MANKQTITRRRLSLSLKFIVLILFLILLFTAGCASILTWIVVKVRTERVYSYAIVFDAGSSHTQMIIFKWLADKSNGRSGTSLVDEIDSMDVDVGITSLVRGNVLVSGGIRKYFGPFIDRANEFVPEDLRSETPILLGATAGVRLLEIKSPQASRMLMQSIRSFFHSKGYRVWTSGVRTITGEEEAISAWISVNAMTSRIHPRTRKLQPYGALDLGGASTQIAFSTDHPKSDNKRIKLFGTEFHLEAQSFLCLGKDQIRNFYDFRMIGQHLEKNKGRGIIYDPCTIKGDSRKIKMSDLISNPCHWGLAYNQWNSSTATGSKQVYNVSGEGNASRCRSAIKSLMSGKCTETECRLNGTSFDRPPAETEFLAFAAFYYVWKELGQPHTVSDYLKAVSRACSARKEDILNKVRSQSRVKYILKLCFDGWYTYNLLNSYGLDDTVQNTRMTRLAKLNNKSVGWAYGFMINQTNMIPEKYPSFGPLYLLTSTVSLFLLWFTSILWLILFLLLCCKIKACEG